MHRKRPTNQKHRWVRLPWEASTRRRDGTTIYSRCICVQTWRHNGDWPLCPVISIISQGCEWWNLAITHKGWVKILVPCLEVWRCHFVDLVDQTWSIPQLHRKLLPERSWQPLGRPVLLSQKKTIGVSLWKQVQQRWHHRQSLYWHVHHVGDNTMLIVITSCIITPMLCSRVDCNDPETETNNKN